MENAGAASRLAFGVFSRRQGPVLLQSRPVVSEGPKGPNVDLEPSYRSDGTWFFFEAFWGAYNQRTLPGPGLKGLTGLTN